MIMVSKVLFNIDVMLIEPDEVVLLLGAVIVLKVIPGRAAEAYALN